MSSSSKSDAPSSPFISSAEFAKANYKCRWLVEGVLVRNQPAVIGGAKKSLKTSLAIDLAISLGSATPFFGRFDVPKPVNVAFMSGESGKAVVQETAKRVCAAHDCDLAQCSVDWSMELPNLATKIGLKELCRNLTDIYANVVFIDPLYLCLIAGGSASASNLYEIGALLKDVATACHSAGATPILIHHSTKGSNKHVNKTSSIPAPMDLDDLAFAGIAELARQWILVNRRTPYDPNQHRHELLMNVGGSAGHSSCWNLDIDEGKMQTDFTGRRWDVSVYEFPASSANTKSLYESEPRYGRGKRRGLYA